MVMRGSRRLQRQQAITAITVETLRAELASRNRAK